MMMVDFGQPPYGSASVTQSVASLLFLLLGAAMLYHFTITPAYEVEGEAAKSAAVDAVTTSPVQEAGAEGEALKGSESDKV